MSVGSADLAPRVFEAGLVDEYHLFVPPIMVRGSKRSLPHDVRVKLELVDERRFGNGIVYLQYRTRR